MKMHLKIGLILLLICGLEFLGVLGDETDKTGATYKEINEDFKLGKIGGMQGMDPTANMPVKPENMVPSWVKDFEKVVQDQPHLIGLSSPVQNSP